MIDNDTDFRYFSVCVERIGYTPIEFGEAVKMFE
jgi:hypothetical protein